MIFVYVRTKRVAIRKTQDPSGRAPSLPIKCTEIVKIRKFENSSENLKIRSKLRKFIRKSENPKMRKLDRKSKQIIQQFENEKIHSKNRKFV